MDTHTKLNAKQFHKTGSVKIKLGYNTGPFSLSMQIMHNFTNQITHIQQMKLLHSYFNVYINLQLLNNPQFKSSVYSANIILTNKNQTFYIKREMKLQLNTKLNPKTNKYSLYIKFIKAPSLFQNKSFTIYDIMDQQSVLKYVVSHTLSTLYDIHCPTGILSIIFDNYLSKFFWSYPEPFIYHSLKIDIDRIIDNIPDKFNMFDSGLLGLKQRIVEDFEISEMLQNGGDNDLITEVTYTSFDDLNKMNKCNINGIGVQIEINDESITEKQYPELFKIFNYYSCYKPDFFAIYPFINPSILYDIKNLYRGIKIFCNDKKDKISLSAQLLIDKNISIDDVAMLWIKWKGINYDQYESVDQHDDNIPSQLSDNPYLLSYYLSDYCRLYVNNTDDNEDKLCLRTLFLYDAKNRCHDDFDLALKFYRKAMQISTVDEILEIINHDIEEHHCGEPLIVLKNAKHLNENEMKVIEMLGIDNYEYNHRIMKKQKYEENMKFLNVSKCVNRLRNKRRNDYNKNIMRKTYSNKYPNKCKKHSYHRW